MARAASREKGCPTEQERRNDPPSQASIGDARGGSLGAGKSLLPNDLWGLRHLAELSFG